MCQRWLQLDTLCYARPPFRPTLGRRTLRAHGNLVQEDDSDE